MPEDTIIDELYFSLLRVPILADIDEKRLYQVASEATVDFFPTDAVIFRQGDYSFDFYIVLHGMVRLVMSGPKGEEYLGSLGRNHFFGEMGSLSYLPRTATAIAEAPTYLLKVPHELFNELMDNSPSFKEIIDRQYRERAIYLQLKLSPLFAELPLEEHFSDLVDSARLILYRKDEWICRQGELVDGFYMIRRGYAQVMQHQGAEEKILTFLTENMYFGEIGLLEEKPWHISVRSLGNLELIKISREAFNDFFNEESTFREAILEKLQKEKRTERDASAESLDILVQEGMVQSQNAILINLDQCIRCNLCVDACRRLHGDVSRLIRRKGFRYENWLIASACYNCQAPECLLGCRFGAIRRDVSGHIHIIESKCTGCGACVRKCPYGVIQLVELSASKEESGEKPSSAKAAREERPKKKVVICDQCVHLGIPACLHNCPVGAIYRGDAKTLLEK